MVALSLQARAVTSGVFGALAKCIKNTDPEADPPLIEAVMTELGKVDGEFRGRLEGQGRRYLAHHMVSIGCHHLMCTTRKTASCGEG